MIAFDPKKIIDVGLQALPRSWLTESKPYLGYHVFVILSTALAVGAVVILAIGITKLVREKFFNQPKASTPAAPLPQNIVRLPDNPLPINVRPIANSATALVPTPVDQPKVETKSADLEMERYKLRENTLKVFTQGEIQKFENIFTEWGNTNLMAALVIYAWFDFGPFNHENILKLIELEKNNPEYLRMSNIGKITEHVNNTALHLALKAKDIDIFKALLPHYDEKHLLFQTPRGNNVFHIALAYGEYDFAKAIYERAIELNCVDKLLQSKNGAGNQPVDMICESNAMRDADLYTVDFAQIYFQTLLNGSEAGRSTIGRASYNQPWIPLTQLQSKTLRPAAKWIADTFGAELEKHKTNRMNLLTNAIEQHKQLVASGKTVFYGQ